jgi:hypothetical protein
MAIVQNVEIVWDDLLDAFSSGKGDRIYFLDKLTGEIFFVPSSLDDEEFWRQVDNNRERFLEIPRFDYGSERQLMSGFIGAIEDKGLKRMLDGSLAGKKPYGDLNDILSFFPEEQERLLEIKDEFFATRVKLWLEENNLFTVEMEGAMAPNI